MIVIFIKFYLINISTTFNMVGLSAVFNKRKPGNAGINFLLTNISTTYKIVGLPAVFNKSEPGNAGINC
ncbi:hypothetical protein R3X26_18895, partial [Vibrio sp. TH_r3]|uniref:hypothetical protein n=1 Tax=Vibrio sp. TH_r3 TaxID=3082084 RepID=UPI002954132F